MVRKGMERGPSADGRRSPKRTVNAARSASRSGPWRLLGRWRLAIQVAGIAVALMAVVSRRLAVGLGPRHAGATAPSPAALAPAAPPEPETTPTALDPAGTPAPAGPLPGARRRWLAIAAAAAVVIALAGALVATPRTGVPAGPAGASLPPGVAVVVPGASAGSPAVAIPAASNQTSWTSPDPAATPTATDPGSTAAATPATTPRPTDGAAPRPTDTPTPPATPRATPRPVAAPPSAPSEYLLMSRSELMARPTSGAAWRAMKSIADDSLGRPDLCDQDNKHSVRTLAAALVFARTGDAGYYGKAREAILSAIGTERAGCHNAILSLGRQLGSYVLAADFINLSGSDDKTFRSWLASIRSRELGGHSRWSSLKGTHEDSNNNWGAFAGASRIAASLYLGDSGDVSRAARVLRGFLGERAAYSGFRTSLYDDELSWTCSGDASTYVPINGACTLDGVDLNGSIVGDVYRGGALQWPPADPGIAYTLETLQGLVLQTELLYRNGYGNAWNWSDAALRRTAGFVTRSGQAGGDGWNYSSVSYHVPWLLNARYGLDLPTKGAVFGRVFGYTDWLYGG